MPWVYADGKRLRATDRQRNCERDIETQLTSGVLNSYKDLCLVPVPGSETAIDAKWPLAYKGSACIW